MRVILYTLSGEPVAQAAVKVDAHGYLHATHPTFQFEVDCALYGYQEGGVDCDTIDDDDTPYMTWRMVPAA